MAINPAASRSQDQLHIHVACIAPTVANFLRRHQAEIHEAWSFLSPSGSAGLSPPRSARPGGDADPCRAVGIAHNVVPPMHHIAQVNANSNLQLSVCGSAQVASSKCILEFDRAVHCCHRAGKLNQKAVAYRFYLLSLMFEERGPQESAMFLEQLQRQAFVALRHPGVAIRLAISLIRCRALAFK
jgi:CDP-diacylglycerol pyrophosphatase